MIKIKQSNQWLAISLMSLSQFLFPTSYIYLTEHNFTMAQANILRSIFLMILCLIAAKIKQVNLQRSIRTNFKEFAVRNIIVLIHAYSITIAHYYLSLTIIHTINNLGPLFVFMWDYYLYGITINKKQIIGIVLGIIGTLLTVNSTQIYLIINPTFESGSTFQNYHSNNQNESLIFSIFFVFVNVLWAYGVSMIKTIKMKDSSQMNFHLALLFMFSAGIHYCLFDIQAKSLQVYIGAIFWSSIPIGIAQILFVTSLTLSKNSGVLTLFLSLAIIVGYFVSIVRYHQNINPIAVDGSILIVSALSIVVLCKDKPTNQPLKP